MTMARCLRLPLAALIAVAVIGFLARCTWAADHEPGRACVLGTRCGGGHCHMQVAEGRPCKKHMRGDVEQRLYCHSVDQMIRADEDAYLECVPLDASPHVKSKDKLEGHVWVQRHCPPGAVFERDACVTPSSRRYKRQVAGLTYSMRLGEACNQNIDCLDYLMYCSAGMCACTSSAVQLNDVCYTKVRPGQSCTYNAQCSAMWPGTTCVSGLCECPTDYHQSATRDGVVCVHNRETGPPTAASGAGGTQYYYCPLPDYSGEYAGLPKIAYTTAIQTQTAAMSITNNVPGTFLTCNPTDNLGCGSAPTTSAVTGGFTTSTNSDLYDCVATLDDVNPGVCCPSRALTCIQPPQKGSPPSLDATVEPLQRYYYDSVSRTCNQFTFYLDSPNPLNNNALNTNGNNFATLDHCISYCMDTCERGSPQYTTEAATSVATQRPVQCSSTNTGCASNYECDRIGSNYLCCPEPSYICGNLGGRGSAYPSAPNAGDPGFRVAPDYTGLTRFFFQASTGTCQTFTYYGGGGNYNNFGSEADCENYCYQELCTYGNPLKTTTGANQRCSNDGDCPTTYSCNSGTGATSIQICCPREQTICEQAELIGTCTNWVQRWWHNPATGECETFEYSGCGGNDNNFKTQLDCQTACRDTTAQPQCIQGLAYRDTYGKYYKCNTGTSVVGNTRCPANYQCYFDGFLRGCCPTKSYTCSLNSDSGRTCGAATSRWYYDTANQRCISFTYRGCDGNANNFPSKTLCETYCDVGGCPNGGVAYREPTSNYLRVCSPSITCPAGFECDKIREGGATVNRCCPTKATVCAQPPVQSGNACGRINEKRFYFNRVTKKCTEFNYQGCEVGSNNFATLAQCENYCSSAACGPGDVAFLDPNTNRPRTCNQQLTNTCPTGYTCQYDTLKKRSVCCGATNEGVCPANDKAYIDAYTMTPRECLPNVAGTCPNLYLCRYNSQKAKYYCCAPVDGKICPAGRAPIYDRVTQSPVACTMSTLANTCISGYSCQSNVASSFTGFCCSTAPICPRGAKYDTDSLRNPAQCTLGGANLCRAGYSCQPSAGLGGLGDGKGYCCEGTGGAENAGCPPGMYVYKDQVTSVMPTCQPFTPNPGCPDTYTCQWSAERNTYQCCGNNPIVQFNASNGCPAGQVAYRDTLNAGNVRICNSLVDTVCPLGYFCQYSTNKQLIQCCGIQSSCPGTSVAYIDNNGSPRDCTFAPCPNSFTCVTSTLGAKICCSGAGTVGGLVAIGGFCGPSTSGCAGGSVCTNQRCTCPLGTFQQGNVCSTGGGLTGYCDRGVVQTVNNVPRACGAGAGGFGCTAGYFCQYSTQRQSYYCCSQRRSQPGNELEEQVEELVEEELAGTNGCPTGEALMYEPLNTAYEPVPIQCQPGNSERRCPALYECLQSTERDIYQCCKTGKDGAAAQSRTQPRAGTGSLDKAVNRIDASKCAANQVLVVRRRGGVLHTTCDSSCPPTLIEVRGVCVSPVLRRLRDDADIDLLDALSDASFSATADFWSSA